MRSFSKVLTLILLCIPLTASATSLEGAEDIESFALEDLLDFDVALVETVSKRSEKATDAPAMVYVISKEDIRLRGYAFLEDVLRDLPGMETAEYYFSEYGTQVPVRGTIGNNKIVVLINGMRVNPPGGEAMMLRSDISVRNAEQIEVVYGPGSTLYGQDAISAVINIKTRAAQDEFFIDAGAASGWPLKGEGWASFSVPFEGAKLSAQIHYLYAQLSDISAEYEKEWNANYKPIIDERGGIGATPERWSQALNAMLRIDLGDSSLQLWHRQSSRSSSEGFNGGFAKVEEAKWADLSTVIEARNQLSFSDDIALESSLLVNRYEIDPSTRYVWANPDPVQWFMDDYKYGIGLGAVLEEKLSMRFGDLVDVLVGFSVAHNDILPKATVPGGAERGTDIASQGGSFTYYETPNDPNSLRSVARINNLSYQTLGGYVETAWQFLDELKLIAGVRFDADTRFDAVPISPRIALVGRFFDMLTVKAIFTRAWVNPAPYFSYNTFFNGRAINTANPELEPEQAMSTELNVTFDIKNLLLGLSVYANFQENLVVPGDREQSVNIVREQVFLDLEGNIPVVLTRSANSGETRAFGTDLYGKYRIGPVGLWASYSFVYFESLTEQVLNGELVEEWNDGLPGISAHNLRLGVSYAILSNLSATASLVFRSTPENISDERKGELADELLLPHELNLHLLFSPLSGLDFFADLRNLSHHHYALDGIFGAYPQETFRVSAGARYAF